MRKRYALVGVGNRGYHMFAEPLVKELGDVAELVALCDPNPHRVALAAQRLAALDSSRPPIPTFGRFDDMLASARPDAVIVCTVDGTHHTYILGALRAGCDAISEKPLTTTAENVRAILAAERDSGRRVYVTFNARYAAYAEVIYWLLRESAIGALISVDFAEFLDTDHGADYFRRWHRRKANSGGLQIHKASHHFDQLNWWIGGAAPGAEPESVYALGARRFYGPTRAERGERCLTCPYTASCTFYLDLNARAELQAQYLQAEHADGYYRDRCVFADEIDIEDTLVVALRYSNGVLVNYSLNAFAPYEGQRIGFNGSKGRLEVDLIERYHGLDEQGALRVLRLPAARSVRVSPLFGRPYEVPFEAREGGHGGADVRLRQHLFRPEQPDPLGQRADAHAGALAVLIGAAVNQSIASGQAVHIAELLHGGRNHK